MRRKCRELGRDRNDKDREEGLVILRSLATLVLVALLGLNLAMPGSSAGQRGAENKVRNDITSRLLVGQQLPALELVDFNGRSITHQDLLGHRVLLTFERSVDW
jgi:hypothetical protein